MTNSSSVQRIIWTSPVRASATVWFVCPTITSILILVDSRITRSLPWTEEELVISRWASQLGTVYATGLAASTVLVVGWLRNQEHTVRIGCLALRTIADTELV